MGIDERYSLTLDDDTKLGMYMYKTPDGEYYVKVTLYIWEEKHWRKVSRTCDCKIRKTLRDILYFRHLLPRDYEHLHSSIFYIDEFSDNKK